MAINYRPRALRLAELASRHVAEPLTGGRVSFHRRTGLYVGSFYFMSEPQLFKLEDRAFKRGQRQVLTTGAAMVRTRVYDADGAGRWSTVIRSLESKAAAS